MPGRRTSQCQSRKGEHTWGQGAAERPCAGSVREGREVGEVIDGK